MGARHPISSVEIHLPKGVVQAIEFKPSEPCILYGVQWGERSMECVGASIAGRPLPGHHFVETDGNQCYLFPAVYVPVGRAVAFMLKATRATGDHLQFLAAFDRGAAEWVEKQKHHRESLIHL